MLNKIRSILKRKNPTKNKDIDPDEIFLDSKNLPAFDVNQFEGRMERPISQSVFNFLVIFLFLIGIVFVYKLWNLQVVEGEKFRIRSDNNNLRNTIIFADRGVIYDRNNVPIVWNAINSQTNDFSLRIYATSTGLSTTLGYVKYPSKDSSGIYYQNRYDPIDGLEKVYDTILSGMNGIKIIETDVKGNIVSESVIQKPVDGDNLPLSIDLNLQRKLNESLLDIADRAGYRGGSGVIMDIATGEILAISNFPEYSSQVMTDGSDSKKINAWVNNKNYPFLNRAINGLYTPGSIMKIFIAMGVLDLAVINPSKQIVSTGSISIPNPFIKDKPSIFLDWKAHGPVDLRRAIAVSSNVYFYEVTGGFESQPGIGILNIEKYTRMFGFGTTTKINFSGELPGTIPSPEWKKKNFNGDEWHVGDTYNTAIGQYGFQVTPLQAVRAVGAIGSGGILVTPTLIKGQIGPKSMIELNSDFYRIIKEGMRLGVTEGTSAALNFPFVEVVSKTGTAQLGVSKDEVNSWVIGFWPYKNPKYAYAIVMERGSRNNQFGAVLVMRELFDWVNIYASEYLQ
ncbi:MAG: hypothetical protein A3H52_00790 [Candidatus Zambryskibacteria bacterium RIFCSPLOWO2_02_FULL_39_26]|nr:MAG: hypothetical protein A2W51_00545 [Candidatus Zambryskibacteria bacterium RIFCSPHIGHO2_02_39_10]OHA99851.1 MAG: hypothetical protein A3E59_02320 [Candidatus Zambryskibacteria bacterium RIFCSPHIGHO2_12_FULL_39_47]OHB10256.1 MAG: hypothetical protein A3H52_00790 [Candidatus Zambryskibacteria bacterium RIFCSPLOWO2_02_FULL_39_26]